jgi:hypothetical protein|tara:strand:+ start:717 stop:1064 length:348 start_codon:yes stop_codon:yes gene_type:complete
MLNRRFTRKELTIIQMILEYSYAVNVAPSNLTYFNPDQIDSISFWIDKDYAEEICEEFFVWSFCSESNQANFDASQDVSDPLREEDGREELIELLDAFVEDCGFEEIKSKYKEVA